MYLYKLINGRYEFVSTVTTDFQDKLLEAGFEKVGNNFYTKARLTYFVSSKKLAN